MSYGYEVDYGGYPVSAAEASASARVAFIRRTYGHVLGAIVAFVAVEAVLLNLPFTDQLMASLFSIPFSWAVVLIAFMAVSWLANIWARSDTSRAVQYAGLGIYVLAEAAIFLPLLWIAKNFFGGDVIPTAALLTLLIFAGLTIGVFLTKHDFSFLGPILGVVGLGALGLIFAAVFFGFSLGLWFCFVMVAFACGAILYHTSNVLHHYRTDQHVAAALALFAAVALLFWYILQIVMSSSRD